MIAEEVYALTSQIPRGKISTYREIAISLGDVRAARAVGRILNENPKPIEIPCHRVVYLDGRVGGYKLGVKKKVQLLIDEGIEIKDEKIESFPSILFSNFKTDYPLKKLRDEQIAMAKKIVLDDEFESIEKVGGVDVAYKNNMGFGGAAVFSYEKKEILEKKIVKTKTDFPYISTYLSYREYPIVKKVVEKLNSKPDVLLIDGNGVLHPFGIGLASHVGVLLDTPTIGVAKNLLCGKPEFIPEKVGDFSRNMDKNKRIGLCLKSSKNSKPIYVSPGHKISFKTSLKIVKKFCKHRIPEPVRIADMIGKKMRMDHEL